MENKKKYDKYIPLVNEETGEIKGAITSNRKKKDSNIEYTWMIHIVDDLKTAGIGAGTIKNLPDETRISQSTFANMKAGKLDNLNVGLIEKMCQLLQCQPSDLFRGWEVDLNTDLAAPKIEEYKEKKRNEQENQ